MKKERIDFGQLVGDVVNSMKPQFAEGSVGLPQLQQVEPMVGQWDRMRIEQVVNNLLTNALR